MMLSTNRRIEEIEATLRAHAKTIIDMQPKTPWQELRDRQCCACVSPIDLPGVQCELGKDHPGKHAAITYGGILWWGDAPFTETQLQCQSRRQ